MIPLLVPSCSSRRFLPGNRSGDGDGSRSRRRGRTKMFPSTYAGRDHRARLVFRFAVLIVGYFVNQGNVKERRAISCLCRSRRQTELLRLADSADRNFHRRKS